MSEAWNETNKQFYAPMIVATEIETAAIQFLSDNMPTYQRVTEARLGRTPGQIPPPKLYTTRNEFTSFPDDNLPLCVVVSPGIVDTPTVEGDGTYSAIWALGVGFAAVARDVDQSAFLAKFYAACARGILTKFQSLGGVSTKIKWVDETYDDLVTEDTRSVRAAYNIYRVHVYDVVTEYAGPDHSPTDPGTDPGSTWPTANTVKIDAINIDS